MLRARFRSQLSISFAGQRSALLATRAQFDDGGVSGINSPDMGREPSLNQIEYAQRLSRQVRHCLRTRVPRASHRSVASHVQLSAVRGRRVRLHPG